MPRTKINGRGWKPIDRTVPRETKITMRTVRGIICKGHVPKGNKILKADRHYPEGKRIRAKRTDYPNKWVVGDIAAVAWR